MVELCSATVTKPGYNVHDLRKSKAEIGVLRNLALAQPFTVTFRNGSRAIRRPSPDLIDAAHVRLGFPMCNLYSMTTTQQAMRQLFSADDRLGNQPPLPGVFPDMEVPIVRNTDGGRELVRARWGWSKAKFGFVTNIRNLDGWPWKHVIAERTHRCLVPASSFAEYHPTEETEKGHKAAVWFKLKGDEPRPPFAFAGFYRRWDWEEDGLRKKADTSLAEERVDTLAMAFLTTEPNAMVAPIHPKAQPVMLTTPEKFDLWLNGNAEDIRELQRPVPDEAMEVAFVGDKLDA
jgi:putative SOS response-associated peptidase YedK